MDLLAHSCAIGSLDTSNWQGLQSKAPCPTRSSRHLCFPSKRSVCVCAESQNTDLPPVLLKRRKKPYVMPPQRGGFLSKKAPKKLLEDPSFPPGNGMLVPELIPVAHAVFEARQTLLRLVTKLMHVVPVKVCMFCGQSHIGPIGHDIATCDGYGCDTRRSRHVWTDGSVHNVVSNLDAYHSYDRFTLIRHEKRLEVKRLPALVELCIQAGVDLPEYPTLRRTEPVRVSGRKIVEADELYYELPVELDFLRVQDVKDSGGSKASAQLRVTSLMREANLDVDDGNHDRTYEAMLTCEDMEVASSSPEEIKHIADTALRIWELMRSGAVKLMMKYTVRACGYCPEVHIGPRGHKARLCGAFKHQWRNGEHGWQVASLDDLIPPKYVWHVPDLKAPLLLNDMRKFYGQAPAIVELCVQAGAQVPSQYMAMMRMDVVAPSAHEAEIAV